MTAMPITKTVENPPTARAITEALTRANAEHTLAAALFLALPVDTLVGIHVVRVDGQWTWRGQTLDISGDPATVAAKIARKHRQTGDVYIDLRKPPSSWLKFTPAQNPACEGLINVHGNGLSGCKFSLVAEPGVTAEQVAAVIDAYAAKRFTLPAMVPAGDDAVLVGSAGTRWLIASSAKPLTRTSNRPWEPVSDPEATAGLNARLDAIAAPSGNIDENQARLAQQVARQLGAHSVTVKVVASRPNAGYRELELLCDLGAGWKATVPAFVSARSAQPVHPSLETAAPGQVPPGWELSGGLRDGRVVAAHASGLVAVVDRV